MKKIHIIGFLATAFCVSLLFVMILDTYFSQSEDILPKEAAPIITEKKVITPENIVTNKDVSEGEKTSKKVAVPPVEKVVIAPEKVEIVKEVQEVAPRKTGILHDDASIQKFVSPEVPFYDLGYVPQDMVPLEKEHIIDLKGNAQLRAEAAKSFSLMAESFFKEFGEKIVVVSTYRSYKYQKGIKDRGCPDTLCSKAGHSEHQSGLAIDFWEASTYDSFLAKPKLKMYFEWLQKNAHTYGFHNSYQKGIEIDFYEKEPWHWRYVGTSLAKTLKDSNQTFTEFYRLKNANVDR